MPSSSGPTTKPRLIPEPKEIIYAHSGSEKRWKRILDTTTHLHELCADNGGHDDGLAPER